MDDGIFRELPRVHPLYGGILVFYKDLEVGDKFRVMNGDWTGEIIEESDKKKLKVLYTEEVREIDENAHAWIRFLKRVK